MFEIKELKAGYSGNDVLQGISFQAQAGSITAILGPNGCGKSTLLKTLCGILQPSGGEILLDGEPLSALPQQQMAQRISYLPQNRYSPDITVRRLVLHGRFPYLTYPRRYRPEDHRIAADAMSQMQITELADIPLNRLSGGQQQKAYIAMALAQNTNVVLLDEPTTYLDIYHQLQVLHHARSLADTGKHILMVHHDLSHAMETADHVVVMNNGRIVVQGTPEDVYCSGQLEQVFHIQITRTMLDGSWRYFFERER